MSLWENKCWVESIVYLEGGCYKLSLKSYVKNLILDVIRFER